MTADPLVYCVVVNWNGWVDTSPCLYALLGQEYDALRVVVVDNGSTDDSVARLRGAFPEIEVVEAGANLGFAKACNIGMRMAFEAGAAFVWLLNNDAIAPADTCRKLVAKAQSEANVGMVGSVLYYLDRPTVVQAWGGGEIDTRIGKSRHFTAPEAFGEGGYLTFASVLIPREVMETVGVLWEGFFLYWEDGDYSLRVSAAGYRLVVAEDTAVLHKEGGSAAQRSPVIDRYSAAAGLHFLRRHAKAPLVGMMVFVAAKVANRLVRRQGKNAVAVLKAVGDYRRQAWGTYRERL